MTTKQTCRECGWAEWVRRKDGRVNAHYSGRCHWPAPELNVLVPVSWHLDVARDYNRHRDYAPHISWANPYSQCGTWKAIAR